MTVHYPQRDIRQRELIAEARQAAPPLPPCRNAEPGKRAVRSAACCVRG